LPILVDLARTSSIEASVLFLLGKLYRIMGNHTSATEMFTHARDLNPRLAGAIAGMTARLGGEEGSSDEESGEDGHVGYGEGRQRGARARVRGDTETSVHGVMLD